MERSSQLLDEALGIVDDTSSAVSSSLPSSSVVLIEDCVETSGAFVIHHILKRALSPPSSSAVVLVSLSHPFSHYDRILRKLVQTLSLCLLFGFMTYFFKMPFSSVEIFFFSFFEGGWLGNYFFVFPSRLISDGMKRNCDTVENYCLI